MQAIKIWSGWRDLNARPLRPERSTLAKLSHIPYSDLIIQIKDLGKVFFVCQSGWS